MNTAAEEAAQWLCELRESDADTREAFVAWLKESARNVREFLMVSAAVKAFDGIGPQEDTDVRRLIADALSAHEGNVIRIAEAHTSAAPPAQRPRRRTLKWVGGIAASVVLAGAGLWSAARWMGGDTYVTRLGEQRSVRLSDGSFVHLNTQSRIRVRFSGDERELKLVAGEALFVVAQDRARPFRVRGGERVIEAIGTEFNVYQRARGTKVSVLEGAVRISGNAEPVSAGEQVEITRNGAVAKEPDANVNEAIAWREQRLIFRGERLEDIAAEFNRYNPVQIRVEGDAARNRRLTGTGTANSPESLVQFLNQYEDLRVDRRGDVIVVKAPQR
jgi:transmembrane sensor